jgi:glycosyltransferase involved in cell wall biosynthesis
MSTHEGPPPSPLTRLRTSGPGFLRRQAKHAAQARFGWLHRRTVGFVFGCQRSGTKMVMRVLDESPLTRIYHENHASAFQDFELRPDPVVRLLVRTSPAPHHVFKPICDSHEADHLLERFPAARGVWIVRDADDVAASAVVKWGDHQKQLIDAVVAGDTTTWGWRTARISEPMRAAITSAWRPDLTPHEGALLFWYLRNVFFLELGLDAHPRMKLFSYEGLVGSPEQGFADLFGHLGVPFDASLVAKVRATSIRRRTPPPVHPDVRALCDGLTARLSGLRQVAAPLVSPVLLLIDTLGTGGAERYVVTVANWLADRGVRVAVASSGGDLVHELRASVPHLDGPLENVRGSLPKVARLVARMVDTHQPRVIVANSLATTWVARLAAPRTPVVNVAHGWPQDRYRVVGPLMRVADRVVAVSQDVRDRLVAGGADAARVTVVHNGVDTGPLGPRTGDERAAARAVMGAGPDDVLVIVIGRLVAQKAHHHVLSIAAQNRARWPRLRYAIVGTGERASELAAAIARDDLGGVVTLTGLRQDVPALLGSADVYLNCSDWEGMPLTTIEAMATGLPVVATRTEGAQQLIDAASGVLVAPGDDVAMADAIARLADDSATRARLGAAASTRARAHFSHDRMVRELADVLAAVV